MSNWTLILTINSTTGNVVTTIEGFSSEALCVAAGIAWESDMSKHTMVRAIATSVKVN